jgi:hypothetical protein
VHPFREQLRCRSVCQRLNRPFLLARQPQRRPAGDEQPQARASFQHARDQWGRAHQMLEVVENQQQLSRAYEANQSLCRSHRAAVG